jgi:hypothetical protein
MLYRTHRVELRIVIYSNRVLYEKYEKTVNFWRDNNYKNNYKGACLNSCFWVIQIFEIYPELCSPKLFKPIKNPDIYIYKHVALCWPISMRVFRNVSLGIFTFF